MQLSTGEGGARSDIESGLIRGASNSNIEASIDPMTLARLDIGLFRALSKLGTSKQRICSALCLSYAEYDYILKMM